MSTALNPKRTVADLKELRSLTGDDNGAQRVAFTPTWVKARAWLKQKLEAIPAEVHTDAAGNFWATLAGESKRALLIGGHIDSVPNGGWLDGCLNLMAGVEILRRINAQYKGKPPVTEAEYDELRAWYLRNDTRGVNDTNIRDALINRYSRGPRRLGVTDTVEKLRALRAEHPELP